MVDSVEGGSVRLHKLLGEIRFFSCVNMSPQLQNVWVLTCWKLLRQKRRSITLLYKSWVTSLIFFVPERTKQLQSIDDGHTNFFHFSSVLIIFPQMQNFFPPVLFQRVYQVFLRVHSNYTQSKPAKPKKSLRDEISKRGSIAFFEKNNLEAKKRTSGIRKNVTARRSLYSSRFWSCSVFELFSHPWFCVHDFEHAHSCKARTSRKIPIRTESHLSNWLSLKGDKKIFCQDFFSKQNFVLPTNQALEIKVSLMKYTDLSDYKKNGETEALLLRCFTFFSKLKAGEVFTTRGYMNYQIISNLQISVVLKMFIIVFRLAWERRAAKKNHCISGYHASCFDVYKSLQQSFLTQKTFHDGSFKTNRDYIL